MDPSEDWSDVSPAVGVAQARCLEDTAGPGLGSPASQQAGAAGRRRRALQRRDSRLPHSLSEPPPGSSPAVSSGQPRDAGDQTRPLWGCRGEGSG